MARHEELRASDARHLIHSLHEHDLVADPLVWSSASGVTLRDVAGQEYIDALAGLWNVAVGHGRHELVDAAARQMGQLAYTSAYSGATTEVAVQLGERLATWFGPDLDSFYFTSGGAEANEAAFKTARYYWKERGKPTKTQIISRQWGYHGVTLAAMSATGIASYWPAFEPRVPGFLQVASPYPYRFQSQRRDVSAGVAAADLVGDAIEQVGTDQVAAVIAEPVQGAGGVIVPPADYFPRLREICDERDVLLIADEVITGFGRTGRRFGLAHWGVRADMVTFAKAITSGYFPLGGVAMSRPIAEVIRAAPAQRKWMQAYTYSAHPVGCAVALANLTILEGEGLVERAGRAGARLLTGLQSLAAHPHVGDVRGLGLMVGIELVADKATRGEFPAAAAVGAKVLRALRERGVLTRSRGDVLLLAPPFIIGDEAIDQIVEATRASIRAVLG